MRCFLFLLGFTAQALGGGLDSHPHLVVADSPGAVAQRRARDLSRHERLPIRIQRTCPTGRSLLLARGPFKRSTWFAHSAKRVPHQRWIEPSRAKSGRDSGDARTFRSLAGCSDCDGEDTGASRCIGIQCRSCQTRGRFSRRRSKTRGRAANRSMGNLRVVRDTRSVVRQGPSDRPPSQAGLSAEAAYSAEAAAKAESAKAGPPQRAADWICGEPLSFLIEVNGQRIYIDSGGTPTQLPPNERMDLAILGMALPDSRARLHAALERLRPRYILPSHQDNFFRPLSAGFQFGSLHGFSFCGKRVYAAESQSVNSSGLF